MGSRIMHYAITTLLMRDLNIDHPDFLMGGLAPDVHKYMNESKDRSHFIVRNTRNEWRIEYEQFYVKYLISDRTLFHLGYYFHLIADDKFARDIYFKRVKYLPEPEKTITQRKYYRDFQRLNRLLIDHYSLKKVDCEPKTYNIDEIDSSYLPDLLFDVKHDFASNCGYSEKLEFFYIDEIYEYIEKTVERCLGMKNVILGEKV